VAESRDTKCNQYTTCVFVSPTADKILLHCLQRYIRHDQATHIYLLAVDSSKYQPVAKLLDAIELLCMIFYLLLNERGGEGDVTCRDEGTHIFAY